MGGEQLLDPAAIDPAVADTDPLQGNRTQFPRNFCHRRAKASDDSGIFRRHGTAGLADRSGDQITVDGLDRGQMNHLGADALGRQQIGGLQAAGGHQPRAEQGHIRTPPEQAAPAPLEGVIRREDLRQGVTRHTEVYRPLDFHRRPHDRPQIGIVACIGDTHVG